jgi:hypothetical protein
MRLLPHQQQLHAEFSGLLWVPPGGVYQHYNDWRERSEPRDGWVSDDGFSLCHVPSDHDVVRRSFRPQRNWIPADQ